MTADRLLSHFHRISEAPDAIPRLRSFILDLAVRGKLVSRSTSADNDPSWRSFCEDMAGRIKSNAAGLPPPFEVPGHWRWSVLNAVAACRAAAKVKPATIADGDWVLDLEDIDGTTGRIIAEEKFKDRRSLSTKAAFEAGDVLYGKLRPYLNKVVVAERAGFCTTEIIPIRPHPSLRAGFLRIFLRSPYFLRYTEKRNYGMKMPRLGTNDLEGAEIPIPPPDEQRRIVTKVDELMALCDRLEAAQAEQENQRDLLLGASLHGLNNGADADAFRRRATFHLSHLPRLTTFPEHISQFRQTIVNLAVRGRLVPQDPNDEPASELLKRIEAERARLVKQGEAKEQEQLHVKTDANEQFNVPETWRWVSLGEISFGFRYGTSVKCSYEPIGEPVLRIPNIDNGRINTKDLKFGPLSDRESADLRLHLGDILMVRSNGSLNLVGRPALVESSGVGYCYAGYLVRVRTSAIHLDSSFLVLALNAAHVRDQIEIPIRTTVGLKNINATELSALTLPLPPLAEQHRIVAKVEELMVLCDRLESQLSAVQAGSSLLLESILHEALIKASPFEVHNGILGKANCS